MSKINVLILGESFGAQAWTWKLQDSPLLGKLYTSGSNVQEFTINVSLDKNNHQEIVRFCESNSVALVVVSSSAYVSKPLIDALAKKSIRAVAPPSGMDFALSRVATKKLFSKYGIPFVNSYCYDNLSSVLSYTEESKFPMTLKTNRYYDSEMSVCQDMKDVNDFLTSAIKSKFADNIDERVLIEMAYYAQEIVFLPAFISGSAILPLPPIEILYDRNDITAAFTPAALQPKKVVKLEKSLLIPVLHALNMEFNGAYRGPILVKAALTPKGPVVLDIYTYWDSMASAIILPTIESDILSLFMATYDEKLDGVDVRWEKSSIQIFLSTSSAMSYGNISSDDLTIFRHKKGTGNLYCVLGTQGSLKENFKAMKEFCDERRIGSKSQGDEILEKIQKTCRI